MAELAPPRTIGALYDRIIDLIESGKVPGLFDGAAGHLYRQITTDTLRMSFRDVQVERTGPPRSYPLPPDIDFKIVDAATGVRHLRWIVDQGEGTDKQPIDAKGLPAHYYRFESVVYEEYLVRDPTFPGDEHYDGGFAFSGAPLVLDLNGVHEFDPNPDLANYSGPLLEAMNGFRKTYRDMLAFLDQAFNCPDESDAALAAKKQAYRDSVRCMRDLPPRADAVIHAAEAEQKNGGLPF
jgi:hypothetical protein